MTSDVEAVSPIALERGKNYFIDLWGNQARSDTARRILEALACAENRQLSRAALRSIESNEGALQTAVATLLRREIVERVDDAYHITVPLVAEFVCRQTLV